MNEEITMESKQAQDAPYRRRVRIQSSDVWASGVNISVFDAETGQRIDNITKIVLTLRPDQVNVAEITYFPKDQAGHCIVRDGEVVHRTVESSGAEADLTAYEVAQ